MASHQERAEKVSDLDSHVLDEGETSIGAVAAESVSQMLQTLVYENQIAVPEANLPALVNFQREAAREIYSKDNLLRILITIFPEEHALFLTEKVHEAIESQIVAREAGDALNAALTRGIAQRTSALGIPEDSSQTRINVNIACEKVFEPVVGVLKYHLKEDIKASFLERIEAGDFRDTAHIYDIFHFGNSRTDPAYITLGYKDGIFSNYLPMTQDQVIGDFAASMKRHPELWDALLNCARANGVSFDFAVSIQPADFPRSGGFYVDLNAVVRPPGDSDLSPVTVNGVSVHSLAQLSLQLQKNDETGK